MLIKITKYFISSFLFGFFLYGIGDFHNEIYTQEVRIVNSNQDLTLYFDPVNNPVREGCLTLKDLHIKMCNIVYEEYFGEPVLVSKEYNEINIYFTGFLYLMGCVVLSFIFFSSIKLNQRI